MSVPSYRAHRRKQREAGRSRRDSLVRGNTHTELRKRLQPRRQEFLGRFVTAQQKCTFLLIDHIPPLSSPPPPAKKAGPQPRPASCQVAGWKCEHWDDSVCVFVVNVGLPQRLRFNNTVTISVTALSFRR